jgi:hypothetical protein
MILGYFVKLDDREHLRQTPAEMKKFQEKIESIRRELSKKRNATNPMQSINQRLKTKTLCVLPRFRCCF